METVDHLPVSSAEPIDTSLAIVSGAPTIIAIAKNAETMVRALETIKRAALKVTNNQDWVKLGSKNYLQDSGTDKVARLFRVSVEPVGAPLYEEYTDERGEYYEYLWTVKAALPGGADAVTEVGTCSSRDKFFGTESRWDEAAQAKVSELKEMSEVHRSDVKKKAYTNAKQRAIKSLLGLDSVTDTDIESFVEGAKVDSVDYGEGKGRSASRKGSDKSAASKEAEKQQHIKEITALLSEMTGGEDSAIATNLSAYTRYKTSPGIETFDELKNLSPGRVFYVWRDVQRDHKKWVEGEVSDDGGQEGLAF